MTGARARLFCALLFGAACVHRPPLPGPTLPLVVTSRLEFPERPRGGEPAAAVSLPPVASFELANGLTVLVVERPSARAISLHYVAAQGGEDRPLNELGWASLVRRVTDQALLRPAELSSVPGRVGQLHSGTDRKASWLALETTPARLEQTLDLLASALKRHDLPAQVISDAVDQQLDALHHELFQQGELARSHARRILFGEQHPLGRSLNGSLASLQALTVAELRVRHAASFAPERSALVMVGSVSADGVRAALERSFAGLPRTNLKLMSSERYDEHSDGRARGLLTSGKTAHVSLAFRAPEHGSKDHAPFVLLSLIGGELQSSRLVQALREQGALTYDVHASLSQRREGNTFGIDTQVAPDSLLAALREIDAQLARLRDQPISRDELALAKLQARERFAEQLEDDDSLCELLGSRFALRGRAFSNAPAAALAAELERIDGVTADQVQDVARRYLTPELRAVAVAGPLLAFEFELSRWYGAGVDFFVPAKFVNNL